MQVTPELIEMITSQVMRGLRAEHAEEICRPKLLILGEKCAASCLSGQFVLESVLEVDKRLSVADYEAMVITQMDTQLLTDIAQGLCHCKHTANARYYQMFVEYLKKLESFGVTVLPMEKICQEFSTKEAGTQKISIREAKKPQTKETVLFTADRARAFARTGEMTLRVAEGTLITPLAKDVLREKKIELIYES